MHFPVFRGFFSGLWLKVILFCDQNDQRKILYKMSLFGKDLNVVTVTMGGS
jgi:hypothetical protein